MRVLTAILSGALLATTMVAKEVKVGIVMPMSGPIGGFGQSANKGLQLANELTPTLKNGDTIKLILVDNKSDKVESANGMQKLVSSDKVTAVIGALTSTNTMAMTKLADSAKVPMVAPVATNVLVTKKRDYVSRVCFNDSFQGIVAANFSYKDLAAKKVVMITDVKQDYSIGISKVFKREYKKLGGKLLKQVRINSGDRDFKAMISSIKSLNPDVIFAPIYSNEFALIAKQAKQLGITAKFMGTDGMAADGVFFKAGGSAVEGFYGTDLYSADAPKSTDAAKVFEKAYMKKYGEGVHPFAALSADAYGLIVKAMNECSNPSDSVCVNKNIRASKNFQGVSGVISLDEKGDAIRSAVINQVNGGKLTYKATVNP